MASDLGATPGEQQLGQSDQANELVHGNPGTIRASAAHLKDFRKRSGFVDPMAFRAFKLMRVN
ncbi:putative T7SS-secreted protein [Streptomyces griseus]|uniref:putative T7SS-secreted protein n=1 Tax=Streptomyces griseus TaxID=1911 RepID=UPI00373AEE09